MASYERRLKMILSLAEVCSHCSMCELGLKPVVRGTQERDPHVLSNLKPHRYMIVGQNPGWTELCKREPLTGAAGKILSDEIARHGLSRDDFYICNAVRCFTTANAPPSWRHMQRCEPFLRMEIQLIRPKLVITLGAIAFQQLCPDMSFSDCLKKIVMSRKYDVPVFCAYHPSPLNLRDKSRLNAFRDQIRVACALIKRLGREQATSSAGPTATCHATRQEHY